MIIARHRRQVIEKIKSNAEQKKFHQKAEISDPVLSKEQSNALIRKFWANKDKAPYLFFNYLLRGVFNLITPIFSTDVQFRGLENLPHSEHAFITSNHYNQLDVLPIKKLAMRQHRRLFFIINDTNLVMHFPIGLIVRNADTIPINHDLHYLGHTLPNKIKEVFQKKAWVLVYPEQEMWFNYCKPRPLQKGAYYYAAKLQVPIISCFVEIRPRKSKEWFHRDFYKTNKIVHILPTIYPDANKSIIQNAKDMREKDYLQKKQAFERAFNTKLDYHFSYSDIAGFDKK